MQVLLLFWPHKSNTNTYIHIITRQKKNQKKKMKTYACNQLTPRAKVILFSLAFVSYWKESLHLSKMKWWINRRSNSKHKIFDLNVQKVFLNKHCLWTSRAKEAKKKNVVKERVREKRMMNWRLKRMNDAAAVIQYNQLIFYHIFFFSFLLSSLMWPIHCDYIVLFHSVTPFDQ